MGAASVFGYTAGHLCIEAVADGHRFLRFQPAVRLKYHQVGTILRLIFDAVHRPLNVLPCVVGSDRYAIKRFGAVVDQAVFALGG